MLLKNQVFMKKSVFFSRENSFFVNKKIGSFNAVLLWAISNPILLVKETLL